MILVGSQRGGAGSLARHLMNTYDNDHVVIQELRGFVGDNLRDAFEEAHAVSLGTKCKQFLFSLSFNPPKDASASIDDLYQAMERAEEKLGLVGQPRALVVHEKNGRRHLHAVWSRIDAVEMKAINLTYFKSRLNELSRELYLENGWELPEGHRTNGWKNPLNFTLAEWQQAKRVGLDPRELKELFQSTWNQCDGLKSFKAALEDRGYFLAKGDRRGFVAIDVNGEVFAVARLVGIKTKEVKEKLGSPDFLPSVDQVRHDVQAKAKDVVNHHLQAMRDEHAEEILPLKKERARLLELQRRERKKLKRLQDRRRRREIKDRQSRFRKGISGLLDIVSGRAAEIRRENERETFLAYRRDVDQRETLFHQQMRERQQNTERTALVLRRQRRAMMSFTQTVLSMANAHDAPCLCRDRSMELKL